MTRLIETAATTDPTPPGNADPAPVEAADSASPGADEGSASPADPLEDLQQRPHPFTE